MFMQTPEFYQERNEAEKDEWAMQSCMAWLDQEKASAEHLRLNSTVLSWFYLDNEETF